jgi:hypothetical protein
MPGHARLTETGWMLLEALDPATPPAVRKGLAKLVRTALSLFEPELRAHQGIHLHRIQNQVDPATGLQMESLEVTEGARLKAMGRAPGPALPAHRP